MPILSDGSTRPLLQARHPPRERPDYEELHSHGDARTWINVPMTRMILIQQITLRATGAFSTALLASERLFLLNVQRPPDLVLSEGW